MGAKCLLLGNGGRESAIAEYVSKEYRLFSVLPYENPTITEAVNASNGKYIIGSPFDKDLVRDFVKREGIDICIVQSDSLLEAGMIDLGKSMGLKVFGPTRKGARVEWSKSYSMEIVNALAPEMIVRNRIIRDIRTLEDVYRDYSNCDFVVKPDGLTAGKGVKVGGAHFRTKDEGFDYAKKCLEQSGCVIVQDKNSGMEFTIMGFTDGSNLVLAPATYDYPYRYDGDNGPGTGGMGCISCADGLLPFLNHDDIESCRQLMLKFIKYVNGSGMEFNGVLNGGFFKCQDGVKFMEFNARLGDPEAMNVINALATPFQDVVSSISIDGRIGPESCVFAGNHTIVVYVVHREYAVNEAASPIVFALDRKEIQRDAKLYFAGTKLLDDGRYSSTGNSRLFAVCAAGESLENARTRVYEAIKNNVSTDLDYRKDIGDICSIGRRQTGSMRLGL